MRTDWPIASMSAIALLQVVGVVVGGPLLVGLMRKIRCRLEGRAGPPVRQPLFDLRKCSSGTHRLRPDQLGVLGGPARAGRDTVVVAAITPLLGTAPAFGWSADLFAVVFLCCSWARWPSPSAPSTPGRRSAAWERAGP